MRTWNLTYVNLYLHKWPHHPLLMYKIEIVGTYVCMFTYSSRTVIPIGTKLSMFIPWDQKNVLERPKLQKIVPIICFKEEITKESPQPQKTVLDSSPSEDYFVARRLSMIEDWHQSHICLFQQGDYRNKGTTTKICLGFKSQWRWLLQLGNKAQ
jgi:hypothetical protein